MVDEDQEPGAHIVTIAASGIPPATLKRAIHAAAAADGWDRLGMRIVPPPHRGVDPAVIVALANLGSAALGALIAGLFSVVGERRAARVLIQRADGTRIEFPATASPDDLARYVALLESSPPTHIEVVRKLPAQ